MANLSLKDSTGQQHIYPGITSIKIKNENGGLTEYYQDKQSYETLVPVEIVIPYSGWDGTKYEITISDHGEATNLRLGIPPGSSMENAEVLIKSGLTLSHFSNYYSDSVYKNTNLIIRASAVPLTDVTVVLWGFSL